MYQRIIHIITLLVLYTPALAVDIQQDWPLYGREHNNQRFSPHTDINLGNVQSLQLAWRYSTNKKATFQTSPIVIGSTMYITTPYNDVIALNAETGTPIWRYEHSLTTTKSCCGPANRGPAVSDGKVFSVTIDAYLIALDEKTGELVWKTKIADLDTGKQEVLTALTGRVQFDGAKQTGQTGYSTNLAPQVMGNKIFVGITGAGYGLHLEKKEGDETLLSVGSFSGGNHGLRGFLVAYDIQDGTELWRWYSVPDENWFGDYDNTAAGGVTTYRDIEKEKADQTNYAGTWRLGGGSIWTTPAIDEDLELLYIGTGNPSPQMDASTRPGDNLHTVSLVALEVETGKLRWAFQQVPHDQWGYDVASPPILFDYMTDNGKHIKAVGQASKLGWFFIHDRASGELLRRSEPFIKQENLFANPSKAGTRIVPGTLGATSWSPASYNPILEYVFIAGIYQPSIFTHIELEPTVERPWRSYTFFKKADEEDYGNLSAISIRDGKLIWQVTLPDPMVGGTLSTAGNLLFTGEGNGKFGAYDAYTGKLRWQYQAKYGVNAPPISYRINSKQYISVVAGGNRLFGYTTGDEVLTFTIK